MMYAFRRALATSIRGQRVVYFLLLLPIGLLTLFVPINTATSFPKNRAQQPSDIRPLKAGDGIQRELAGGESHLYQLRLEAGQFMRVVLEQKGIDLVLMLAAPDGKQLVQVNLTRAGRLESLAYEVTMSGDYRLTVRAVGAATLRGAYQARLGVRAAATAQDRQRITAERLLAEADRLNAQGAAAAQQLLEKSEQALVLWRELGDQYWEAHTLSNLNLAYQFMNRFEKAIECLEQALRITREIKDRASEGAMLNNLSVPYFLLSRFEKGIEYVEQALAIRREVKDRTGEAGTLLNLGNAYHSLGRDQKAIEYYEQALPISREVRNQRIEVNVLGGLGATYDLLNQYEKAIEYHEQALAVSRELKNRAGEGHALNHLGRANVALSRYQKGMEYYEQALAIWRELKDRRGEGMVLSNLSTAYYFLDQSDRAIEYSRQALAISREVKDREIEGSALNNLGIAYIALSQYEEAIAHLEQALGINRELKERVGQGKALYNVGNAHRRLGRHQKAIEYYEQALAISREAKDRATEGRALTGLGTTYSLLTRYDQATACFEQALSIWREVKDRHMEAYALYSFAKAESEHGNFGQATALIEESLKIAESLRAGIYNQELRTSYFASTHNYSEVHIDLLMQMHEQRQGEGNNLAALQASERARARSLLELLTEARADIRQGADPALLQKERALQQQLNAKAAAQTRLLSGKYTEAQAAAIEKELADLTAQLAQVETQIRATSPRYAALTQPQPLTVAEIQQQVLDDDALLLEYALGEKRSYLWAVTPTSINSYQLPPRAEIETAARKVYDLLTARQPRPNETETQWRARVRAADAEYPVQAAVLSQRLLGPVAAQLGNKRLLIVAPGALQYLSFAALPVPATAGLGNGGKGGQSSSRPVAPSPSRPLSPLPLITAHEIVSLPSASALAVLRRETVGRQPAPNLVAVLADPVFSEDDPRLPVAAGGSRPSRRARSAEAPPQAQAPTNSLSASVLERAVRGVRGAQANLPRLVFTREEADAILAAAPSRVGLKAVDFRANRATATGDELGRYRIVHFATHGLLNSEHPELSGLVLSLVDQTGRPQDGFLRLHEIYNLRLPADLVVLSACQTGLGKEIKGEGLVGLTRGFMYAGAPRVVASLWQVNDAATADLMKHFYHRMLREGLRPAEALRAAQIEIWKQRQWQAPYYWGAFVLQGEWK